jgi:hypothetical protein
MHAVPLAASSDRCNLCGVPLAPDQSYCVECGEPRGTERRLPLAGGLAPRADESPSPSTGQRANSALIAGIGTLLLAMGIGVLIGRSGTTSGSSSKSPGVQVVTVAGGGGAATAATGPAGPQTSAAAAAGNADGSNDAARAASAVKPGGKVQATQGKVVHVGSSGHGPGYQKGKFTGNFFGGP